jgi:hypothetical protein
MGFAKKEQLSFEELLELQRELAAWSVTCFQVCIPRVTLALISLPPGLLSHSPGA